jgi:uncharacterized protein
MSDCFVVEDQSAVADFLADPATHGGETPTRIDTHGAMIFQLGDRVYKMKRAVQFPYMDFSTREKRLDTLRNELAINRRTAPDLYCGIAPISKQGDAYRLGALAEEDPSAVEHVLVMHRFEATFEEIADRGELSADQIVIIAEQVASFHREAEIVRRTDPAARVRDAISGALQQARSCGDNFAEETIERVGQALLNGADALRPVIRQRSALGMERLCHGDLHLRNICLFRGEPALFDAIDFNPDFARIDVLYDLAFLLMDLEARGLRRFASITLNTYLDRRTAAGWPDETGLVLLPLFLSLRALIRAEVGGHMATVQTGETADVTRKEAQHHLACADQFLQHEPARLVAIGGLSGSGKSTLAAAVAPLLGRAPGARWLRSDVLRKALAGVGPFDRLPEGSYNAERSAQTYRYLLVAAERALSAGQSVVLDAVYARPGERFAAESLAAQAGAPFHGIWLDAPEGTRSQRVDGRTNDASDADARVATAQSSYDLGAISWQRLDASAGPEAVAAYARAALEL